MTSPKHDTETNIVIDIATIEAEARQLRAETLAAFGRQFRTWLKSLDFGFIGRTAH